jgi:hypothetical protein
MADAHFFLMKEGRMVKSHIWVAALLISAVGSLPAAAQARPGQVSGVVRDEGGRFVAGATVVVDSAPDSRQATTDSLGQFIVRGVRTGPHLLRVVKIGHSPFETTFTLPQEGLHTEVQLARIARLDTVAVTAARTGVFGKVLAKPALEPIHEATVAVVGVGKQMRTTADGSFESTSLRAGAHMVSVTKSGFASKLLSFVLPVDSAVELAVALDHSAGSDGAKRLSMLLSEFDSRVRRRGSRSAIVARQELAGKYGLSLGSALRYSPSFLKANLVLSDIYTCVFVNGRAAPFATADDFGAMDVVAVEVYGLRQEHSASLMDRWPPNSPCGRGEVVAPQSSGRFGLQSGGVRSNRIPMDNVVRALVIWTVSQ